MIIGKKSEPLVHITKRTDVSAKRTWLVRGIAILAAFLVSGIMCLILTKGQRFWGFYSQMFSGTFGTKQRVLTLFQEWAMLMCIALAVTPAFKMKFWNIGAEGQTLMGALGAGIVYWYFADKIPSKALLILLLLVAAIFAGALWGFIPAIFKARFNTNETLFTLMLNYIAIQLVNFFYQLWLTNKSGNLAGTTLPPMTDGSFATVLGEKYVINVVIVTVITALMFVYLRFSKHGYELEVVGESVNTAKYVGIHVKSVIVRTMILSGALCGIAGFLLLFGIPNPQLGANLVKGRGFTAILVSWLAQFNPIIMIGATMLVVFMQKGTSMAATTFDIGSSQAFCDVIVGLFFLIVIASEFFVRYRVQFRPKAKEIPMEPDDEEEIAQEVSVQEEGAQEIVAEDLAQEEIAQEDIAQETPVQDNGVAQEG